MCLDGARKKQNKNHKSQPREGGAPLVRPRGFWSRQRHAGGVPRRPRLAGASVHFGLMLVSVLTIGMLVGHPVAVCRTRNETFLPRATARRARGMAENDQLRPRYSRAPHGASALEGPVPRQTHRRPRGVGLCSWGLVRLSDQTLIRQLILLAHTTQKVFSTRLHPPTG